MVKCPWESEHARIKSSCLLHPVVCECVLGCGSSRVFQWKPPKVLPTEQRVGTMRPHSVTERSEVLIHATTWMNLENITPYRSPSLWKVLEKTRGKSGLQDSKCSSKAAVVKAADIDRRTDKRMKHEKAKKQILIHGHYLWWKRHYRAWEKDSLFKNSAWFQGGYLFVPLLPPPRPRAGKYAHEKILVSPAVQEMHI